LAQNFQRRDVDARLAVTIDMNVGRFVICRVDDKPQPVLAKKGNHAINNPTS
jgi:hypothetical protein